MNVGGVLIDREATLALHSTEEDLARAIVQAFGPAPPAPVPDASPAAGPRHAMAERRAWPWLPTLEHRHLAPHPYCSRCGAVKYVGSLRAVPMGGLVNLAARLRDRLEGDGRRVTEAQFRLVVKRLEAAEADDTFLQSRSTQENLLLKAFEAVTRLDAATLASYLRSC